MERVAAAVGKFKIKGDIRSIHPFGGGHINDSFRVETSDDCYLFQRINTRVFTKPEVIFRHYDLLRNPLEQGVIVPLIPTHSGEWWHLDSDDCWRLQPFVPDTKAIDQPEHTRDVAEVSKGFALFNKACLHLDVRQFQEVIPGFHDLNLRLRQLEVAKKNASPERLQKADRIIRQAEECEVIAREMEKLWELGLPLRVSHNDTKANNVLLDASTGNFRYVIDLDTVGPGSWLFDFGDLMRTMLSPTGESEAEVTKIKLRKDWFEVMTKAYLEVMSKELMTIEKSSLVFGGMYMTYIMAVRFLADYLNGDIYYKTSFEEENLVRARNQLALLKNILDLRTELEEIVRSYE